MLEIRVQMPEPAKQKGLRMQALLFEAVLLMERAMGPTFAAHGAGGEDDVATRIICRRLGQLHVKRAATSPAHLLPLVHCFQALSTRGPGEGGIMAECAAVADELLRQQKEHVVPRGDAHHSNILDFGERGWLAIDPKRVTGERYYDYVNVLCNPDLPSCTEPERFARQLGVVLAVAGLERQRLLRWVMAQAALSAAWFLEESHRSQAGLGLMAMDTTHARTW